MPKDNIQKSRVSDTPSTGADDEKEISVTSGDDLELSEYDAVALPLDLKRAKAMVKGLVPLAGAAVDTAEQWNQALVKFPKNYGWADMTPRKAAEFKGYMQAGIEKGKDGYQGQIAVRQAKLQPAAVANLVLQGAALAVGQAYMTEINDQLGEIQEGIAAIQGDMRADPRSET